MQITDNIVIDKNEVLRYLGYSGQRLSASENERIDAVIGKCSNLNSPAYTYRYFDVLPCEGGIELLGTNAVFKGNDISQHLYGCKGIALMAVTAGFEVERELMRLQKVSMTDAVIFDACATACIECGADYVQNIIAQQQSSCGCVLNSRFSPGYGDFPLETQKDIFALLECEKRIGLTLTESMLMLPSKSVTAVVGIFDGEYSGKAKSCSNCKMYNNCIFRKGGNHCGKNIQQQ